MHTKIKVRDFPDQKSSTLVTPSAWFDLKVPGTRYTKCRVLSSCVLTDNGLPLDAVAGVVVGAGHGRQLAVGRRDVAELVAQAAAFVERAAAAAHGRLRRVVYCIVCGTLVF